MPRPLHTHTPCAINNNESSLATKPHGSEEMKNLQSFVQKMTERNVQVVKLNQGQVGADGLVRNDQFDFILGHEEC